MSAAGGSREPPSSWREASLPEPPNVLHVTARHKLLDYARAAAVALRSGAFSAIKVVGCGDDIERAVKLAEFLRRRFMAGEVEVGDIKIGTLGRGNSRLSFIEIEVRYVGQQSRLSS